MQLKPVVLAVAALTTAPAFALTPAQVDSNTVRLWLSGASAPTASVFKGVLTLCRGMQYKDAYGNIHTNPGTRDAHLYLQSDRPGSLPGNAGDFMAYACTVQTYDGRAGSLEGRKMVVYHTVQGGSFNYVAPHITIFGEANPNLPGMLSRIADIETLGAPGKCASGTAQTVTVDISGMPNNVGVYRGCRPHNNPTLNNTITQTFTPGQTLRASVTDAPDRPEGGFSDTEYIINKLNLGVMTELSDIGTEVSTNIGQVFGVAVSYPLYAQLQKNDGLITTTALDGEACDSNYAPGPCQPNLPAHKYTTIAARDYIGGVDGTLFGAAVTPPGTSGKIQLHRRVITSGTQSASNLRFLNMPCATGAPQGALEPARSIEHGGDNYDYVTVFEHSTTGGVKNGLTNASNAGEFALGVVSMENVPTGSEKYAFVKLNGVSPNSDPKQRASAMRGDYDFWYELVAFTAHTAFAEGRDLINAVNQSLGNPGITDLTGLFITPVAGVTGPNVGVVARNGNSCQPIIQ